ncbi:hypothetical protein [Streptomyces acidicola]|uniref:hypothetical protein n=1 Tax=Streptomyces acidicola TaxID=2596892 RepID=UPI00380B6CB2
MALVAPSGEVIEGRAVALEEGPASAAVRAEVPDPEGGPMALLVARSRARVAGWEPAVREVLDLAVAPLTAWAATERLAAERTGRRASELLLDILGTAREHSAGQEPGERDEGHAAPLAQALALGWPVQGPLDGLRHAMRRHPGHRPWPRHGAGLLVGPQRSAGDRPARRARGLLGGLGTPAGRAARSGPRREKAQGRLRPPLPPGSASIVPRSPSR